MNTSLLRKRLREEPATVALFDLNDRLKFRLTGEDRVRYLNGQVSQDVKRLAARPQAGAQPGCVMNAKGKMNALLWISATDGALRLDADPLDDDYREELAMRLERYIISDDAELSDETEERGLLHLLWSAHREEPPALREWLAGQTGVELVPSRRYGLPGLDLLGTRETLAALAWPPEVIAVDATTAETFRIEQGVPRWGAELTPETIPVEAGLDAGAIDYHKGCYIGQEIISRIKSVGRVNRKLTGFLSATPLEPGTHLYTDATIAAAHPEGGAEVREAGVITSSAWSFALDKAVSLGYLRRGTDATRLHGGAQEVEVRTLPLVEES